MHLSWFCAAVLVLIFGFGIYLRLSSQKAMQWLDDSARDVLIAEKISEERKYFQVKPESGGLPELKNSSLYFDGLSILRRLAGNREYFFIFYTLLISSSLLAAFMIGEILGGWKLGSAFLIILAIHARLIFLQTSIYQRYLPASLILWILLVSLKVFQVKSWLRWSLLIVFAYSLFFLHHSLLTVFPIFLIVVAASLWIRLSKFNLQTRLLLTIATVLVLVYCWFLLTGSNIISIFGKVANSQNSQMFNKFIFEQQLNELVNSVYGYKNHAFTWTLTIIAFFSLPILAWQLKSKKLFIYAVYLFSLSFVYLLGFLFDNSYFIANYYLEHYITLLTLLLPTFFYFLAKKHDKQKYLRSLSKTFFLLAVCYAVYVNLEFRTNYEFAGAEKIYQAVSQDANQTSLDKGYGQNWMILDQSDWTEAGWFSPAFWFFADSSVRGEMIGLRDVGNNLFYDSKGRVDVLYIFCHHLFDENGKNLYDISTEYANGHCLNSFDSQTSISPYFHLAEQLKKDNYLVEHLSDLDGIIVSSSVLKVTF